MTLATCKIICTVFEQKSFLKASQILHLTPSAISHAVKTTESELGFSLFHRTTMQPTTSGEILHPYLLAMLQSENALQQAVAELNGLERGTIRLGAFNSVCTHWIPNLVKSFHTLYPYIIFDIYQGSYNEIKTWLRDGTIDLGFLSTSVSADFEIRPLYDDPLVCVTPLSYHPKNKTYITIEEMQGEVFISQRQDSDVDMLRYLESNHLTVHTNCHVMDDLSTLAMVRSGFGISLLPQLVVEGLSNRVAVYPIQPKASRTIGVVSKNWDALSPAVRRFYEYINTFDFSTLLSDSY